MGDPVPVDTDKVVACATCASILTAGAAFCTRCGSAVPDRAVAPPTDERPSAPAAAPVVGGTADADADWTGLLPVGLGLRTLSFLLDLSVLLVVGSIATVASIVTDVPAIATVIAPMVVAAVWLWNLSWLILCGNSFGRAAVGIRAIGVTTVGTPGAFPVILRSLLFVVTAGLVSVTIVFDRSPWHRGWHDIATGIIVVDALNGRNPLGPRPVVSVLRRPERGLRTVAAPIPFAVGDAPTARTPETDAPSDGDLTAETPTSPDLAAQN